MNRNCFHDFFKNAKSRESQKSSQAKNVGVLVLTAPIREQFDLRCNDVFGVLRIMESDQLTSLIFCSCVFKLL